MDNQNLIRLVALLTEKRDELLATWRRQVRQLPGAANLDAPTINDQVPELFEHLADALKAGDENHGTNSVSAEHGLLRWQAGFDVTEVVAEYDFLHQCLQDAAERDGIDLSGKTRQIVNCVFDDAIRKAVKAFETMMTIEIQHRHDEHLAFVLHDLRTPLEALSLATTLLERSLPDEARSPSVESALSVLRGNINRLSGRVRHVLAAAPKFAKSSPPQFVVLKLRAQAEKVVRDLEPLAASAETQVKNEIDEKLEVFSDELLLAQILENLLANALKFTAKGIIEIGARETNDGDWIECWVKDSGQGIPAIEIERVFERFQTGSDPKRSGMGLGLAIVKEIVELHKGEVRVQSEPGKGSTFTFVLPGKEGF